MAVIDEAPSGKALITGASGFIGGNLRDALLEAGVDVVAICRPSSPAPKAGRSVVADYADVGSLEKVMRDEKPDWVFHVAGATNGVSYEDFQRANVMPTKNLLQALGEAHPGVSRFVHVSSLASFGPSEPGRPKTEDDPQRPIEHYGQSKLEAEDVVRAIGDSLPWTIVRPSGVYGPRDSEFFLLFREIEKGRNVFYGNRQRWFSLVYGDDCVRALVLAATVEAARGRGYFLDDGRPLTWQEFQDLIIAEVGRKPFTLDIPPFFLSIAAAGGELMAKVDGKPRLMNGQKKIMGEQAAWTCSSARANAELGWHPEVDVEEGIKRTLAWYRKERWF